MSAYISLDHPRFLEAERAIFTSKVVSDCMSHQCRVLASHDRVKLDACCSYGVDVDIAERDAILRHKDEIAALLEGDAARAAWFDSTETVDADFPSGRFVRTATRDKGCIFLSHDRRGCAIHRSAIEKQWDFRGVKPHVCRLFPLSYQTHAIVLSDDYADYSCSRDPAAPSVYRVSRDVVGEIFGEALVGALDEAERTVLGPGGGLRVLAS